MARARIATNGKWIRSEAYKLLQDSFQRKAPPPLPHLLRQRFIRLVQSQRRHHLRFLTISPHQDNQMNTITTKQEFAIIREWTRLLISLKPSIADDYRCTDDPDDKSPGMLVTFGLTCCDDGSFSWSYQTGDNSYSGGAYSHRAWGLAYLNRRSNCRELAEQAFSEALDATFA